jgi:hypothetical protein
VAFDERPVRFEPSDIARAGAFVSIDGGGHLRVERGFVRPEDEAPVEPSSTPRPRPTRRGLSPHGWRLMVKRCLQIPPAQPRLMKMKA